MELSYTSKLYLKAICFISAATVFTLGYPNLRDNYNTYSRTRDKEIARKVDSLTDHTEVIFNKNGEVEVERNSFFGAHRSYHDTDGDKKVDRIFEMSSLYGRDSISEIFYRNF